MALSQPYLPKPVDRLTIAFPANVVDELMPAEDDIPEDYRRGWHDARPWVEFQQRWFFEGMSVKGMTAKPGIDKGEAIRHLTAIQRSFEPKHQHKEAAVAYLASLWFESPPPSSEGTERR